MLLPPSVELRNQAGRMRELGCTYGQGYFFAQPTPGDAVAAGAFDGLSSGRASDETDPIATLVPPALVAPVRATGRRVRPVAVG